jgi:hypothetical protein
VSEPEDEALGHLVEAFEEFLATPHDRLLELLTDEWLERCFTEDVEWSGTAFDLGTYQGFEGSREYWRHWLEPWRSITLSYEPLKVGARLLMWIPDQEMEGRSSGARVRIPGYAWVCSVRDGRVSRVEFVIGRQAAEAKARA